MAKTHTRHLKKKDFFTSNPRRTFLIAAGVLLALTLAMFYDALFGAGDNVLSKAGTDLSSQFVYWRAFGFGELQRGNLALWNPHVFGGAPFLGGFQSALLYPPNWLFLALPLPSAINWSIALHVYLLGMFMYLWASRLSLRPPASLVSSACLMFSAPYFLHIYAGHLSMLNAMAWVPLMMLAIDGLVEKPSLRWSLVGMLAVAMQILAGHPQTLFFASVAAVLYAGLRLVKASRRGRILAGLAAMFVCGAALGAVQILPGFQAAGEGARAGGASYEYAAMFSFPPENFLTLLAPGFFGNMEKASPYWGRCYLWEMSLFAGAAALVLAVYGAARGRKRLVLPAVGAIAVLLLLALGSHTPLLRLLYRFVPGFNMFRGYSKFIFPATVFITMLSGVGLDVLLKDGRAGKKTVIAVLAAAVFVAIAALGIRTSSAAADSASWWHRAMLAVGETGESYLARQACESADFVRKAGAAASNGLFVSAGTILAVCAIMFLMRFSRSLAYVLALLAVVEVFVFARSYRPVFRFSRAGITDLRKFLDSREGDYRVLNPASHNVGMLTGGKDIWGYEPGIVRRRYAQFMAFTQGQDRDRPGDHIFFRRNHPLYAMLRLRFVFIPRKDGSLQVIEARNTMPRLQLLGDYKVLAGRDEIFAAMNDPKFDPRKTVILETDPSVKPAKTARMGEARLVDSSTDHLTIEADLPDPAILLVTDTYSTGWRAAALPGGVQDKYEILPANYVLRAIPLKAGKHRILLEYLPRSFVVGKWISIVSVLLYACAVGLPPLLRRLRKGQEGSTQVPRKRSGA